MKRLLRDYPIVAIALLLIACVKFEYNWPNSSISFPGLAAGLFVLAVVGIVLLFRIFNAVQDVCIAKGVIPSRLRFKYDILIPIAFFAAFVKAHWQGESTQGMTGKEVPQWQFSWSDPHLDVAFIGAVIGVVLLLRVLTLVRAISWPATLDR